MQQNEQRERNALKNKFFVGIIIIVFFSILTGCFGALSQPNQKKMNEVKALMLEDLETKYKKDFVIKQFKYIANTSDYEMNLHLEGNEHIGFMAYFNKETGQVGDTFLLSYWREESETKLVDIFYKYFPEEMILREHWAAVNFNPPSFRYQMVEEGYPSLETIIAKYPEKIEFGLGGEIVLGKTKLSEAEIKSRLFKVIEEYKNLETGFSTFDFFFYTNVRDKKFKYRLQPQLTALRNAKQMEDLDMYWTTQK